MPTEHNSRLMAVETRAEAEGSSQGATRRKIKLLVLAAEEGQQPQQMQTIRQMVCVPFIKNMANQLMVVQT